MPQTLKKICDPPGWHCWVDDMQVGMVRPFEEANAVTMQVARVLDAAQRCAGVFTRHMSWPKELMGGIAIPHGEGLAAGRRSRGGRAVVLPD